MTLKIKAFIYRFSNIFGYRLYLAKREEQAHMAKYLFRELVLSIVDDKYDKTDTMFGTSFRAGMWQVTHNFTTVYTKNMSGYEAIWAKVRHAFDFYKDDWDGL